MKVPRMPPTKMATKGAQMHKQPMKSAGAAKNLPTPTPTAKGTYGVQAPAISADVNAGLSGLKGAGNVPARMGRAGVIPKTGKTKQMGAGGKKAK